MTIVIHENEFHYYNANKSKNIKLTKLNSKENEDRYFKRNKMRRKVQYQAKTQSLVVVQKLSTRIDGRPFISRSRDDVYRNIQFTLEKHLNDERTTIADEKHPQQLHQTAKIVHL